MKTAEIEIQVLEEQLKQAECSGAPGVIISNYHLRHIVQDLKMMVEKFPAEIWIHSITPLLGGGAVAYPYRPTDEELEHDNLHGGVHGLYRVPVSLWPLTFYQRQKMESK